MRLCFRACYLIPLPAAPTFTSARRLPSLSTSEASRIRGTWQERLNHRRLCPNQPCSTLRSWIRVPNHRTFETIRSRDYITIKAPFHRNSTAREEGICNLLNSLLFIAPHPQYRASFLNANQAVIYGDRISLQDSPTHAGQP